jgi:acyl-CoA synthetase (AMP-forming)/AMP-acid ligase II
MPTLPDYLRLSAKRFPDKIALVSGSSRLTYRSIAGTAESFSSFLLHHGLAKGDRVAVFLENSPEAVIAIFGILGAAGCVVVVNPATQHQRLGYILESCSARFLVTSFDVLEHVEKAKQFCATRPVNVLTGIPTDDNSGMSFEQACRQGGMASPHMIDLDLAAILYTSGSTGQPKGVTMLHRNFDVALDSITSYLHNNADDVILSVLPLSSSYGILQLLATVKTGGCLVLEKGFGFPYDIIKRIKEECVTGLAGTPTVFAILLKMEDVVGGDFASLRYVTNAAAALPATFVPKLRNMFPQTKIYLMHGLTECLRTTYLPPEELESRPTSVGRGMQNVELWLEDEHGVRVPSGTTGEMMVRSSAVMQGYWNDLEATSKALAPGRYPWERVLRTGDLFVADDDGYFYFVARMDEIIKSKGEKVSPIEVENTLYMLDAVHESRVVGVSDPVLGQAIQAEIVLKEGKALTIEEVKAHCKQHLEDFKVPKFVKFVDSLPKTHGGKIKRSPA